ncbi:unnamed protein product, partial [Meganyctiphanes norvegica]
LMKQVVDINKYSRSHHIPSALLSDCQGSIRPQLPGDTRWKSKLDCIDSYTKNQAHMVQIIQDNPGEIDCKIVQKIMNHKLYVNLVELAEQLRPVAVALDRAQADSTNLADAYDIMKKLLTEPLLAPHCDTVQKRFDKAIQPCHMVAYMLHPKYNGHGM